MARMLLWYLLGKFIGERSASAAQQPSQPTAPESVLKKATGRGPHYEIAPDAPLMVEWEGEEDASLTLEANVVDGPAVTISVAEKGSSEGYSFTVIEQDPMQERNIHLATGTSYQIIAQVTPTPTNKTASLYLADEVVPA